MLSLEKEKQNYEQFTEKENNPNPGNEGGFKSKNTKDSKGESGIREGVDKEDGTEGQYQAPNDQIGKAESPSI